MTGGFSKWRRSLTDEESFSEQLAGPDLEVAMIVALVPAYKQTEDSTEQRYLRRPNSRLN